MTFPLETIGSILSLSALETVLGVDNVIFLSILVGKLPYDQQAKARRIGLVLALGMRIVLLMTLKALSELTQPFITLFEHPISWRDVVLVVGGAFLIGKSSWEIFADVEGTDDTNEPTASTVQAVRRRAFFLVLIQIAVMDIVFSLDSVITAVGMAPPLWVMVTAMFISMLVMLGFAKAVGDFVNNHPSTKVLALAFLVMIGTMLVAEGGGQHIPKGYIYAAMAFAFVVEMVNLWVQGRSEKKAPETVRSPEQMKQLVQKQARRIAELEEKLREKA
jgi:predicted tellurium resistance membrane protein TerC